MYEREREEGTGKMKVKPSFTITKVEGTISLNTNYSEDDLIKIDKFLDSGDVEEWIYKILRDLDCPLDGIDDYTPYIYKGEFWIDVTGHLDHALEIPMLFRKTVEKDLGELFK